MGDPPLSLQYHADGDFWFYVGFDLDDIPTIFAGDYHRVEVLGITLAGRGRYEQFPAPEVWTSERASPVTKVRMAEIRDLPDEIYLDQIQSRWGNGRVNGVVSKSTLALFTNNRRNLFPPVARVSYGRANGVGPSVFEKIR